MSEHAWIQVEVPAKPSPADGCVLCNAREAAPHRVPGSNHAFARELPICSRCGITHRLILPGRWARLAPYLALAVPGLIYGALAYDLLWAIPAAGMPLLALAISVVFQRVRYMRQTAVVVRGDDDHLTLLMRARPDPQTGGSHFRDAPEQATADRPKIAGDAWLSPIEIWAALILLGATATVIYLWHPEIVLDNPDVVSIDVIYDGLPPWRTVTARSTRSWRPRAGKHTVAVRRVGAKPQEFEIKTSPGEVITVFGLTGPGCYLATPPKAQDRGGMRPVYGRWIYSESRPVRLGGTCY